MKVIEVKFDNGETWHVPLKLIAEDRADYYEEQADEDFNREEEIGYVMNDSYKGIDWFENNMNWIDVKENSKLVSSSFDYEEEFINADKEIIQVK